MLHHGAGYTRLHLLDGVFGWAGKQVFQREYRCIFLFLFFAFCHALFFLLSACDCSSIFPATFSRFICTGWLVFFLSAKAALQSVFVLEVFFFHILVSRWNGSGRALLPLSRVSAVEGKESPLSYPTVRCSANDPYFWEEA